MAVTKNLILKYYSLTLDNKTHADSQNHKPSMPNRLYQS